MTNQNLTGAPTRDKFVWDPLAVCRAANEAVRQALQRHKLLGQSIVVWRDGKCVWIAPEDIQVPPAPDSSDAPDPIRHAG